MRPRPLASVLLAVALASASRADETPGARAFDARTIDVEAVALRARDSLRADRTYMRARVTIRSSGRSSGQLIEFRSWDDRIDRRAFIRVLAPKSDAGVAFLHLPPNVWSYQPDGERTLRVPSETLLDRWLRADFTLEDLLHRSSEIEDYEHRLLGVEARAESGVGARSYVVEYTPRASARTAWGKIVAWIDVEHGVPIRREFYGADGKWHRSIRYDDIRAVGERRVPHRWTLIPADGKGRESSLEIREIEFDGIFDDSIFSPANLKPSR